MKSFLISFSKCVCNYSWQMEWHALVGICIYTLSKSLPAILEAPKTLDMASDDYWWVLSLGGWMWYMTHCSHRLWTYPSTSILYQLHTGRCLIHALIQKSTTVSSLTWKYMLSLFSFLLCTNITVDLLFSAKPLWNAGGKKMPKVNSCWPL